VVATPEQWAVAANLSPAEQVNLSLQLVQVGFFALPGVILERDRRQVFRITADGIEVVVPMQRPHVHVADGPETGLFHHELMARAFGVWRIAKWTEPVSDDDQEGAQAASIGAVVRELIGSNEHRESREALGCRR
jgi:hypothetical protein